jgi:hypothetical protein
MEAEAMDRYVISSITEVPGTPCQWELVTPEGEILLLTYSTGELMLCKWVSTPDSPGRDGIWQEVAKHRRDDLPILERMRDCHITLDEAIAMLGPVLSVTSYVASYEMESPAAYDFVNTV